MHGGMKVFHPNTEGFLKKKKVFISCGGKNKMKFFRKNWKLLAAS